MLRLERDGAVARLLIDRPHKRNAFEIAMWEELAALIGRLSNARGLRVLLLASADPAIFSAGADLDEFASMMQDQALRRRNYRAMRAALDALAGFPKPSIACIPGPAHGAGLALAAACDLRIAGRAARFALPPARLGLVYPAADLARILRLIGTAQTKRLIFTAEAIDAEEAFRIGLIDMLVPDESLENESKALALRVAANSPASLMAMKAEIDRAGVMAIEKDASSAERLFLDIHEGADCREGLAAFRERRAARFSDQD